MSYPAAGEKPVTASSVAEPSRRVAIFGGGPAGLFAAGVLADAGVAVTIHEAMPTPARKFLLAGKSGLNLTHSEDFALFRERYGSSSPRLRAALDGLPPAALRAWADALGADTFAGSSGRVFPRAMKGSPLLRAWIARLKAAGVTLHTRHRWLDAEGARHRIETPEGPLTVEADAVLFAFGGGSWPRLGSDGSWVPAFHRKGVPVAGFEPANCGFDVAWSDVFRTRFAGAPVKAVVAMSGAGAIQGEFVISTSGVEGSLIYAHAAALREALKAGATAPLTLDLAPGRTLERLSRDLQQISPKLSFSNRMRRGAGIDAVKTALLRECFPDCGSAAPAALAAAIKRLPVPLIGPRPLAEAISSAGGIGWQAVGPDYQLQDWPGAFVAGEMIDWEAPTGGYLLTACMATGKAAAEGILAYLSPPG